MPKTIYVNSNNTNGVQNGKSWRTAYSDLQSAQAALNSKSIIWLAKGNYIPSRI